MIYLKKSTKLRKYLLGKYQQICMISHTCSIKCKYLQTHRDSTLIFGMLIVLYVRNKNIEKIFCLEWGFWGHARSQQMITFLFI